MTDSRNTFQRRAVIEVMHELKHASAEDVYNCILKLHPNISLATVYRNLKFLVNTNELQKIKTLDGSDKFDITVNKHNHLFCRSCKKIFDIEMDNENIENHIKNKNSCIIESCEVVFTGLCSNCKNIDN